MDSSLCPQGVSAVRGPDEQADREAVPAIEAAPNSTDIGPRNNTRVAEVVAHRQLRGIK